MGPDKKALLIFDVFKGQKNENYRSLLEMYDIIAVYVPANTTKYFQPLELTINGVSKTFLKDKFGNWLQLSVLKPIHASWLISLQDYFRNKPVLIIKGLRKLVGIIDPINLELETEDPFEDLL